jgi:hypothetical protein
VELGIVIECWSFLFFSFFEQSKGLNLRYGYSCGGIDFWGLIGSFYFASKKPQIWYCFLSCFLLWALLNNLIYALFDWWKFA